jgi:hypothetical protein
LRPSCCIKYGHSEISIRKENRENYDMYYHLLYLSMALQPFVRSFTLFSFLILYTVGRTPWTGDQLVAKPLPIRRTTQTQNKRTQTSMSRVGFEPTTPMLDGAKTVHALDGAAIVIGVLLVRSFNNYCALVRNKNIEDIYTYDSQLHLSRCMCVCVSHPVSHNFCLFVLKPLY